MVIVSPRRIVKFLSMVLIAGERGTRGFPRLSLWRRLVFLNKRRELRAWAQATHGDCRIAAPADMARCAILTHVTQWRHREMCAFRFCVFVPISGGCCAAMVFDRMNC